VSGFGRGFGCTIVASQTTQNETLKQNNGNIFLPLEHLFTLENTMKNTILAALTVLGISGLVETNQAEAQRFGRRGVSVNIGNGGVRVGVNLPGQGRISRPAIVRPSVQCSRHYHVKFHATGTRRRHFHSHSAAHRFEDFARRLGFHATLKHNGGHYDVYYHMHGTRSRTYYSHSAAHRYERYLERLGMGIHAWVTHH
jgi:hypothetical protein